MIWNGFIVCGAVALFLLGNFILAVFMTEFYDLFKDCFKNQYYEQWWKEIEFRAKYPCPIEPYDWFTARRQWIKYENSKKKRFRESFTTHVGGCPKYHSPNGYFGPHIGPNVTQEAYNLIKLCQSPYAQTLLRVYWHKKYNGKKNVHQGK